METEDTTVRNTQVGASQAGRREHGVVMVLAGPNHGELVVLESDKGLSNVKGTIAMARQDGTNTTTATSEFFFNVVDNHACLDIRPTAPNCDQNGYAVFGKVIAGLDTLDKITALKVDYFAAPTVPTATFWVQQLK
jgi:peptidyl-prolyl cis-trans isomerase A (cyclophilin A)